MTERRLGHVDAHLSAASSVATAVPAAAAAAAAAPWRWSGEGGSGQLFELQGHAAFVITPTTRATGPIPWVWYAPTLLPGLPNTAGGGTADPGAEVFMFEKFLKAGVAVAPAPKTVPAPRPAPGEWLSIKHQR